MRVIQVGQSADVDVSSESLLVSLSLLGSFIMCACPKSHSKPPPCRTQFTEHGYIAYMDTPQEKTRGDKILPKLDVSHNPRPDYRK